jgi:hypothetical protein
VTLRPLKGNHLISWWKPHWWSRWRLRCLCGWEARTWRAADRKDLCRGHLSYDRRTSSTRPMKPRRPFDE